MYNLVDRFQLNRLTFFSGFVIAYLLILVFISGTSQYSPDSWSYFELAKKIHSDNFYKFNTYRSYFSDDRSASFPFGFPALLAVINKIFGWNPLNAAYLNLVLAFSNFLLIQRISLQLCFPKIAGLALATSFLFYPGFLNEVVSGRSYPAATLLVLIGLYLVLISRKNWHLLIGGALVGASVLVRFDFLFTAWVSMMLFMWFKRKCLISIIIVNIGFVLGIIPWIIYSLIYFSKIWISDNSWVAISASNAYVLDFPARASETLFTNPFMWLKKIIFNGYRVAASLTSSLQKQQLILLLFSYLFIFRKSILLDKENIINIFIVIFGFFLMLSPYLMTGYFDSRYFTFIFLIVTILIIIIFDHNIFSQGKEETIVNRFIFSSAILIILFFGIIDLVKTTGGAYWSTAIAHKRSAVINAFAVCHNNESNYTYIFVAEARHIAFQYGALTGNKVALLPSNFDNLDQESRNDFFQTVSPYRLFTSLEVENCDALGSPAWFEGDKK